MGYLKQDEVSGNVKRGKKKTKAGKETDWRSHYHTREEMEAALSSKPEKEQQPRTGFHGPAKYGRYYWCVKTELSEDGEIYVFADDVRFTPTGAVLFVRRKRDAEEVNLALAPGQWTAVYAGSCFDGNAVAVEHWKGEVVR